MEDTPQSHNLTAEVYRKLRKGILSGVWADGEALTEAKLAASLQVSRTPVREALHQLELEGLVALRPNRGAVVVGIRPGDLEDAYELRSLLEGRAAEKAALHASPEDVAALREAVDLTAFYLERGSFDKVTEMDDRFHRQLYLLSGSRMFQRILTDLHAYVGAVRERSIRRPGRAEAMVAEHRAIVDALAAGDAVQAGRLMNEHIACSARNMEKHLLE